MNLFWVSLTDIYLTSPYNFGEKPHLVLSVWIL